MKINIKSLKIVKVLKRFYILKKKEKLCTFKMIRHCDFIGINSIEVLNVNINTF